MSRIPRLEAALADRVPKIVDEPDRKLAAVAIVFAPDPDSLLLIKRADREGDRWSGQMAFPGGRWDPADQDLATTARRETHEEVGVDLGSARLLGRLDDLVPRTPSLPPVTVAPFLFALPSRQALTPNHEVAVAQWTAIEDLIAPRVYRLFEWDYRGVMVTLPGYHLEVGVVWGMTERILTPVLGMLGCAVATPA